MEAEMDPTVIPLAEEPPPEEDAPIATLHLSFGRDGSISLQSSGARSHQLWGAAGMLHALGDRMFAQQAAAAEAERAQYEAIRANPRGMLTDHLGKRRRPQ
jgi:hypothetical protein